MCYQEFVCVGNEKNGTFSKEKGRAKTEKKEFVFVFFVVVCCYHFLFLFGAGGW
jgi:hypothetical protein